MVGKNQSLAEIIDIPHTEPSDRQPTVITNHLQTGVFTRITADLVLHHQQRIQQCLQ